MVGGDRWEVLINNCSSAQVPTLVLRKKMTPGKCIMIVRVSDIHFVFEKIEETDITKWSEEFGFSGLEFTDTFGTIQETFETAYRPIAVGDIFQHPRAGGTRHYVVKFIAGDGSLIAWDEERQKSFFVNRQDRDQLRAYGMELR